MGRFFKRPATLNKRIRGRLNAPALPTHHPCLISLAPSSSDDESKQSNMSSNMSDNEGENGSNERNTNTENNAAVDHRSKGDGNNQHTDHRQDNDKVAVGVTVDESVVGVEGIMDKAVVNAGSVVDDMVVELDGAPTTVPGGVREGLCFRIQKYFNVKNVFLSSLPSLSSPNNRWHDGEHDWDEHRR